MKEKHGKYGEQKTQQIQARLTPTGKEMLQDVAKARGVSVSELLEQIARGQITLVPSLGEFLAS